MRLILVALLFAISYAQTEARVSQTIGAEKFVPDEIPQPPQSQKEGVLPPLTELAENNGMKEHKEKTRKLDAKVIRLENEDVSAGNALVKTMEQSVVDSKKKLELAKESRDSSKEKVQNDERNHVAAGIFMHAEINAAKASKKKFEEMANTAETRAGVKVKQAQADVSSKNEIISQKDSDIERLNTDIKNEQTRAEEACDARIGKQRREQDGKTKQLTQIKDDEIAGAKAAATKAEESTTTERQNCATEAEAAKGRCTQEVDGVKQQVTQLQGSLKEKNDAITAAGTQCQVQVTGAKNQCIEEKKGVQEQARTSCDVEVNNERGKVKTAENNLLNEKKKLADIEKRLTKDKDDAIAVCEEGKEVIDRAARDEIKKNQKTDRDTCDKQKTGLKAASKGTSDHLNKQIYDLQRDYKKAMATMTLTQQQELKALREQLRAAERARDDFSDKFSNCNLKFKQVKQQMEANLKVTQASGIALNSGSTALDLEEDVASAVGPEEVTVAMPSGAMVVYMSLILSSLFLSGLVVKLRGESLAHKNYNTVLRTEA